MVLMLRDCIDIISVEPCHPNPCHNTGTCEADGVNFICRCPEGFTGQTCATGTDLYFGKYIPDKTIE